MSSSSGQIELDKLGYRGVLKTSDESWDAIRQRALKRYVSKREDYLSTSVLLKQVEKDCEAINMLLGIVTDFRFLKTRLDHPEWYSHFDDDFPYRR